MGGTHIFKKVGKKRTEGHSLEAIDQAALKADGKDPTERNRVFKYPGKAEHLIEHHFEREDRDQHYLLGPGVSLRKKYTSFSKIGEGGQRL